MVFYLFSCAFYIIRNVEEASLRAPHKLLATTFCVQLIIDDAHRGSSVPCCWHHVADIKYKCTRAACAPFVWVMPQQQQQQQQRQQQQLDNKQRRLFFIKPFFASDIPDSLSAFGLSLRLIYLKTLHKCF